MSWSFGATGHPQAKCSTTDKKTTGCQYLGQRGTVGQIDILGTGKLAYVSTHQMKDILFDIDLKSKIPVSSVAD